ncbi:putative alpha/beta hydrolase domain (DUF2235), partial [Teratosphaeria destructans]
LNRGALSPSAIRGIDLARDADATAQPWVYLYAIFYSRVLPGLVDELQRFPCLSPRLNLEVDHLNTTVHRSAAIHSARLGRDPHKPQWSEVIDHRIAVNLTMTSPIDFAHVRRQSTAEQVAGHSYRLPKKLIVCCDGTWMDSDNNVQNPSNVTRIARAVKSEDDHHHPQIVYYQNGIGTGIGLYNHLVGAFQMTNSKIGNLLQFRADLCPMVIGGGTGLGLAENIREAYAFLASNYSEHQEGVPPDSIFLLGFSRGAFTARSLGGFVCTMGILKKQAMPHFLQVFEDWERAGDSHYEPAFFKSYLAHHHDVDFQLDDEFLKLARSKKPEERDRYLHCYFKKLLALDLTQEVDIKAIGVWDTVGSLGIPVNPLLQRMFNLPSFFRTYRWFDTRLDSHIKNGFHALALDERRFPYSPAVWEREDDCQTNLEQVWFPGAHSNIGGSYNDSGMANITLAWMMDRMSGNMLEGEDRAKFQHHDWIQFDEEYIKWWYDCQLDWYEKHKEDQYKGWARGKVYDSNTFPSSLAGTRCRGPGRNFRTFYESGRTDFSQALKNTNEAIHSSVRARIDMGGRGVETNWDRVLGFGGYNVVPLIKALWRAITRQTHLVYQPQRKGGPLHGWKLDDGHKSHLDPNYDIDMSPDGLKEIQWIWDGEGANAEKRMPEAKLGKYERILLQKDETLAEKVEFTNNGWHWFKKPAAIPPRHGRTF